MTKLSRPLDFANGRTMKNRFMLAPLTNQQSHGNGILSDEAFVSYMSGWDGFVDLTE